MVRRRERCVPPVHRMEEPATKKPKVDGEEESDESEEGECDPCILQENLLQNCLCRVPDSALYSFLRGTIRTNQSDSNTIKESDSNFPNLSEWDTDRVLKFLTCIQLLSEVSIKQELNGMICSRISDICDALVKNENGLVDQIIDLLMHNNSFVNYSACKALSNFFVVCNRNVETSWLERIIENALMTLVPFKMTILLDVFKRVIEWKDNSPHPLEDRGRKRGRQISINPLCNATSLMDTESPSFSEVKCICVKVLETKWLQLVEKIENMIKFYTPENECAIVTFLELWLKIISIKQNLSVIDTKLFYLSLYSFGVVTNENVPSVVWKHLLSLFNEVLCYGSTLALQDYPPEEASVLAVRIMRSVRMNRLLEHPRFLTGGRNISGDNNSTGFTGGSDRPLFQMMALLVLKSVAVTVKETLYESSSDESSVDSENEEDLNRDMAAIEWSIIDVLRRLNDCVKQLFPYHERMTISRWVVQLFADQDDALLEAMVCCLDVTVGLSHRPNINLDPDQELSLNPTTTFVAFLHVIGHDEKLLIDFLVSTETCFLLYLLRLLKYIRRNWIEFVTTCGHELDATMSLLMRLKFAIERLVRHALFPYNIHPILKLLEKCERLWEEESS